MPYANYSNNGTIFMVDVREHVSGGGISEGEEDLRWPSYDPSHIDADIVGVYHGKESYTGFHAHQVESSQDIAEDVEYVYLVICRYTDGDTFSTTYGNWHVSDVLETREEAEELADVLSKAHYRQSPPKYSVTWRGNPYTLVGAGYFEHLESIEVKRYHVKRGAR